jgi:hypothetical protein
MERLRKRNSEAKKTPEKPLDKVQRMCNNTTAEASE